MSQFVLILGGARSGKSRFAKNLAQELGGDDVLFVATAQPLDVEMAERITRHQAERPSRWKTCEWPRDLGRNLSEREQTHAAIVVDCLTLWVSNLLLSFPEEADFDEIENSVREELDSFARAIQSRSETVIVVSGEVGQGIVPESQLARRYRDLLGWANQSLAETATAVYQLSAGLAIELKQQAVSIERAAHTLQKNA